jgi:hypothetical protein
MIPLTYFLVAWVVLLGIFGLMMLVTLLQMLRHGLPSTITYITTFFFLVVTAGTVIGTSLYLTQVDWNVGINVIPRELLQIFPQRDQSL